RAVVARRGTAAGTCRRLLRVVARLQRARRQRLALPRAVVARRRAAARARGHLRLVACLRRRFGVGPGERDDEWNERDRGEDDDVQLAHGAQTILRAAHSRSDRRGAFTTRVTTALLEPEPDADREVDPECSRLP